MTSINELYLSVYEKLKTITEQFETAKKQFYDSGEQNEIQKAKEIERLELQLEKVEEYSAKIDMFRQIAEKNLTSKNFLTIKPRVLNFNRLREWTTNIDPMENDDPYAQRVYVLAKSNELFLSIKKGEFERKLRALKENETDLNDADEKVLEDLQKEAIERCREVLESEAFAQLAMNVDKQNRFFENCVDHCALQQEDAEDPAFLGLGVYARPLPVLEDMKYIAKAKLGDYYDLESGSILLPVEQVFAKECVLQVSCVPSREKSLYRGIQNYVLNMICSAAPGREKIYILDALHYNNISLGPLKRIEGGAFIETVPRDAEQITDMLKGIVSEFTDIDDTIGFSDSIEEYNETVPAEKKVGRKLLVLIGYPTAFSHDAKKYIDRILLNQERYGISLFLVDTQYRERKKEDEENKAYEMYQNFIHIKMLQKQRMLSKNGGPYRHFRWYELKHDLPESFIEAAKKETVSKNILGTEYIRRISLDPHQLPPYERGKKKLELPFAVDERTDEVHEISFENEMFASYLVGASRSGKSTMLHTLITDIIRDYHPDDVELWLADFKMAEFKQYIDPLPPHVKYILLDESPELVYDLVDKLTDIMIERQTFFSKTKWSKVSEVPHTVCHMPIIFVILDEFSIMSQAIAESQAYKLKLQNLLAKGAALGIKFLFSSQTFTSGVNGLTATAKAQIQSRISMKGSTDEISMTLELSPSQKTDQVRSWIEALPPHYALVKYRGEDDQMHVKRLKGMYFKDNDFTPRDHMVNALKERLKKVDDENPLEAGVYKDKHPVIVDGSSYRAFDSVKYEIFTHGEAAKRSGELSGEETLVAFGSPRRMNNVRVSALSSESRENLLLITGLNETACAASVLYSAIRCYEEQGLPVRIWAYGKDRIFRTYRNDIWSKYKCVEGIDDICDEIREMAKMIREKKQGNELIIMLGMDRICADFELIEGAPLGVSGVVGAAGQMVQKLAASKEGMATTDEEIMRQKMVAKLSAFKRAAKKQAIDEGKSPMEVIEIVKQAQEEFLKQWKEEHPPAEKTESTAGEVKPKLPEPPAAEPEKKETAEETKGAYNAHQDLNYIIKQGSRLGYHFFVCLNSRADLKQQMNLKEDFFRYRMAFRVTEDESRMLFGNKNASLLPEHICQYFDMMDSYSFRPYLHKGISWDGFYLTDEGDVGSMFDNFTNTTE